VRSTPSSHATLIPAACRVLSRSLPDLMNVGGTPPSALGQASIDIMHGLPRYGSGEHTLGVIDPGNSDTYETNKNYAVGIILPFGILIGLGLLTWSSCFGFCAARACCDSCGKRAATRSYTSRDQVCLKVWIILSAMVFVVLFGIGIVSNAAVSSSLDESYKRSDAVVELLYEFNGPVKKMSISAADALAQVEYLNTTVYSALPSPAQAAGYIDCTNLMYSTVTAEQQLLVAIAPITGSSSPSGSNRALNFTLLSLEMRAIRPAATALQKQLPPEIPNLVGVNTTLQAVGPQPLYTDGVLPSQRVSTAQNLFLNGSSTGALFSSQLDPTLNLLQPTVQPLRNVLGRYEQSAQTCGATTQQAVYNEVNSGSVTAQTRSDIAALNQSIALLPSLSEFNAAMNNFQTYFTALTAIASTLTTSLDSYRSAIADLSLPPAFTSVLTSMQTSVPTYQAAQSSANANTTRLQSSLRQTGISTSAFSAQVTQLSLDLQSAQTAVQSLKEAGSTSNTTAGGAPSLGDTMKMVNYTLPQLNCIRPIFSQLLSLNKTILILPDQVTQLLERRNQLLVQLQRITRVQYDLTASYYALSSFNSSLSGFPNLTTTIQATNALATAVAQFPDCQQASVQLGQIQTAMDTMTGGYLSSLQSGYSSFTTAATNAQSDVNSVAAALDDLSAAIQQVAPQLQAHTTYASNLATVVTALQPDLTAVYQQSIQPAFTPIVDPLRTRFLGELQAYATVFATAPDRARLDASLSALSANITSTLSSDGSISSTLNNLQTAAQAYTDSTPVFTALNGIYLSQTQAPLAPLFTTLPHLALNASLSRFPDVSSQATLVSQSQSGLQSQSSVFKLLEADLQTSRGFLTRDDVDTMQNNINAMVNIVTNFPDLNSSLSSLSLAAHGLSTATNSLSSYHHEYYVARQTTVVFKNHIDWLRLLGYLLVLLVPTCVSVCGFTAWLGKRPSVYRGRGSGEA
jgi:hypothetical protein